MKLLAALLLGLAVTVGSADGQAPARHSDPFFGPDKVKHFFIAGFIESMTFAGLEAAGANRSTSRAGGVSAALAASFGREVHDRRTKGHFSIRDLAWDVLGTGAAMLVRNKTQK